MCNLSDLVEERAMERGFKKGMERGMECGMERGMEKGMERGMLVLLYDMGVSIKDASERVACKLEKDMEEIYEVAESIWV